MGRRYVPMLGGLFAFVAIGRREMRKVVVLLVIGMLFDVFFCSAGIGESIDLISLVDLDRDVVSGVWELMNGELISVESPPARLSFPYRPPLEYDYTIEFTLAHDGDNTAQLASRGDVPFTWSFPAGPGGGYRSRLEDINGHSVIGNPTLVSYDFLAGHRYTSTVRVRNDRVICEIDGQVLVEYQTDYTDLSRNSKWEMPDQLNLGLGGYGSPTTFHSATVQVNNYSITEFPICTESGDQINPAISGNTIVWQDYRNDNWDIYGYDLSTQNEFPISTNASVQGSPDVSDNLVVWQDNRHQNNIIFAYNLATQAEFMVSPGSQNNPEMRQEGPSIDGDIVVWNDKRNFVTATSRIWNVYG